MTLHYVFAFRFPVSLTAYRTARTHTLSHTHTRLTCHGKKLHCEEPLLSGPACESCQISFYQTPSTVLHTLALDCVPSHDTHDVWIRLQYDTNTRAPQEHGRKTRGADWYSLPYSLHSYTYRIRVYAIGALSPHTLGAWFMMRNGQEAAYRITSKRVKG